jgi:hypothetical protein
MSRKHAADEPLKCTATFLLLFASLSCLVTDPDLQLCKVYKVKVGHYLLFMFIPLKLS